MNQHHASSSGSNNALTPMELGAAFNQQHKQLTQADKDFRKANGLCLYCGSKDHILRNCNQKKPMINNGIALTMEGEISIDLAAVTHFTSGKRKLPTDFLDSLDVGEIKKVATSKFQSIIVIPITAYHGPNEEEASADDTEYVCKAFCAITIIRIDDTHHVENTTFHILESCSFHVILGMQWLKRHRPHLSFNDNYQKIIMNCLTTRCTPVNFDIESPVAKLLGATTTTTASSPVAAETTLSYPTTPVVEILTPLVVTNRPPTPHPSILDIEPFSETPSIADAPPPSLLQVEPNWPEPTTCAIPSVPSIFQMEPFWEEEKPVFTYSNPIVATGWQEAPFNAEEPGSA
ncbi:hypothetical protein HMPREF1544_12361 [Mucor circinelloides 1006PhL]|uniref:CCHC-type domain-containing protein n=1 Tax=Mucor circinelloides f. circinelloides (strain 1006PhL) TaxID=1220926 RepID=S2JEM5_MUCC1|nr:hypothetical protein HMPREF1544_12361 [Mucor circinelloides 1006PhL]